MRSMIEHQMLCGLMGNMLIRHQLQQARSSGGTHLLLFSAASVSLAAAAVQLPAAAVLACKSQPRGRPSPALPTAHVIEFAGC
jgi:hypothetical protein